MTETTETTERPFAGYTYACYEHALGQGLAPMALALTLANEPFFVEQMGGFCMTIAVYFSSTKYVMMTAAEGLEPEPKPQPWWRRLLRRPSQTAQPCACESDPRWLVCYYDDTDEELYGGDTLHDSATTAEAIEAIRAKRQEVRGA